MFWSQEDFPIDLENCITLDELEEELSDDQGKPRGIGKSWKSLKLCKFKAFCGPEEVLIV